MEEIIKLNPKSSMTEETVIPNYRRLTFISMDSCDFCDNVQNPGPFMYYISFESKNGWVTCSNELCRKKGEAAVDHFMRTKAYGKANHLRGKCIKVKRTAGNIESDWTLSTAFTEFTVDCSGVERVCVVDKTGEIEKWVSVSRLLEWNS